MKFLLFQLGKGEEKETKPGGGGGGDNKNDVVFINSKTYIRQHAGNRLYYFLINKEILFYVW